MIAFPQNPAKRTALFLMVSLISLVLSFFNILNPPVNLAWIAVVLCGVPIIKDAVIALVTRLDIKADLLVSMALVASAAIGEVFAAGEVAFIMTIGAYLEEMTTAKARSGIEKLAGLRPRWARIARDGAEVTVPAEQVRAGDILRVLAGETVPADGVILSGKTSIDQSIMTGESLPVDKSEGDTVISGTVNQFGAFEMRALKDGADSSVQGMIRLVEQADPGKAKITRLTDRWATWIVLAALGSAALTGLITGEIIRSVTILVVFCPCALALAAPTAIMAGIGGAARRGILISQGDALERLAAAWRVAFDKTGTLTVGKPVVTKIVPAVPSLDERSLLELTASVELRSEHPLGKAVAQHYRKTQGNPPPEPEGFVLMPGRGVTATVCGRRIVAGNEALFKERNIPLSTSLLAEAAREKAAGATIIYVAHEDREDNMGENGVLGFIALSDSLRPEAPVAVEALKRAGMKTALLTGDGEEAARHIAQGAGILDVCPRCLPEDKLAAIRDYQDKKEPVCMVGDGINDAPALKAAFVGIAMGAGGSDIAVDAADMVLTRDDLAEIPYVLNLSRKVMRTIKVNVAASLLLNGAALTLAALGLLDPVLGALAHNAGSVAVIINSSLLLTPYGAPEGGLLKRR